jgi:hypothetical protein
MRPCACPELLCDSYIAHNSRLTIRALTSHNLYAGTRSVQRFPKPLTLGNTRGHDTECSFHAVLADLDPATWTYLPSTRTVLP